MIYSFIRILIAAIVLGLLYAGLAAMPDLPPQAVTFGATVIGFAQSIDRVFPAMDYINVMIFEAGITLLLLPLLIILRLWKRFSPNA